MRIATFAFTGIAVVAFCGSAVAACNHCTTTLPSAVIRMQPNQTVMTKPSNGLVAAGAGNFKNAPLVAAGAGNFKNAPLIAAGAGNFRR